MSQDTFREKKKLAVSEMDKVVSEQEIDLFNLFRDPMNYVLEENKPNKLARTTTNRERERVFCI